MVDGRRDHRVMVQPDVQLSLGEGHRVPSLSSQKGSQSYLTVMETEAGPDDTESLWYRTLSVAVYGMGLKGEAGGHLGPSVIQASITHQPIFLMFPITFK